MYYYKAFARKSTLMFQTFGFEPLSKIKLGDICYDVSV